MKTCSAASQSAIRPVAGPRAKQEAAKGAAALNATALFKV